MNAVSVGLMMQCMKRGTKGKVLKVNCALRAHERKAKEDPVSLIYETAQIDETNSCK